MKKVLWAFFCLLLLIGCYRRPDPAVQAAQDLERMVYDFAEREEEKVRRLQSLRLGMSDREVLDIAGPPSQREGRLLEGEGSREVWVYRGAMRVLARLTFENGRLVEIRAE